ncbi:MAG: MBL fold metallo-hydrolase, partial [Acidobacteriota bacterium]
MRFAVLGSGSAGNAIVVEASGRRLLIDAGFSCRRLVDRLRMLGVEARSLDGVLLTHEHGDHTRGARLLARRFDLEVLATRGTLDGVVLDETTRTRTIRSGEPFELAGLRVESFALPHDAREPVGFALEDSGGCRLGVVGDLGCRTQLAWARLRDLDALVLESNYDLQMLRSGPYPWVIKQRIAGRHGHLSNEEAGHGLRELVSDRLRHVVLYHLSQTNNLPA